jgi:hypothetical protein
MVDPTNTPMLTGPMAGTPVAVGGALPSTQKTAGGWRVLRVAATVDCEKSKQEEGNEEERRKIRYRRRTCMVR